MERNSHSEYSKQFLFLVEENLVFLPMKLLFVEVIVVHQLMKMKMMGF